MRNPLWGIETFDGGPDTYWETVDADPEKKISGYPKLPMRNDIQPAGKGP